MCKHYGTLYLLCCTCSSRGIDKTTSSLLLLLCLVYNTQVLVSLLPELSNDEHGGRVGALASKLEMAGAGIIVWSDFW
jgi:hypothetical protein